MPSIALSLGHNSSAIAISDDGEILGGYEEERFSTLKSDSAFPINSITALTLEFMLPKDTSVFVGHWFLDAQLPARNKYWDPQVIRDLFPNGTVDSLSADFSHHDSHLESAMVFAGADFPQHYHAVVADGFGSFGEVITMYEVTNGAYKVLHRVFGFEKSMGMLYQYATAFMGMKMHNHEYKMLAYEVHIDKVVSQDKRDILDLLAKNQARTYLKGMHKIKLGSDTDPVVDLAALPNVQMKINEMLVEVLKETDTILGDQHTKRVVISYFVQRVVELVITSYVTMADPHNLLVVGGLFYNVKLNHILANKTKGKFCAMPLAGDQGAGLGVYNAYKGNLKWPDNLFWGSRNLYPESAPGTDGLIIVDSEDEAYGIMSKEINNIGYVNLVRGRMEYGPRALCNTSTIAVPDPYVTANINRMNDRTAEMPFAPVVTYDQAKTLFHDVDKIHKSLEYMIVARTYRANQETDMMGAAHYYPDERVYTGRPQITADPLMVSLLSKFGPLVNTSFNYHGVPIVMNMDQIIDSHVSERNQAPDLKTTTVVIRN